MFLSFCRCLPVRSAAESLESDTCDCVFMWERRRLLTAFTLGRSQNAPVQVAFLGAVPPSSGFQTSTLRRFLMHEQGPAKPSLTRSDCGESLRAEACVGFLRSPGTDGRCHEEGGGGLNISTTLKKLQKTGQFHQPCVPGWWLRPDRPKEPARAWGAAFHLCVKRCKCFMD